MVVLFRNNQIILPGLHYRRPRYHNLKPQPHSFEGEVVAETSQPLPILRSYGVIGADRACLAFQPEEHIRVRHGSRIGSPGIANLIFHENTVSSRQTRRAKTAVDGDVILQIFIDINGSLLEVSDRVCNEMHCDDKITLWQIPP
jgi:hypothetical protein